MPDHLDHASPKFAVGGKLGLDCTGDEIDELGITLLEDSELLSKMKNISSDIKGLKQYYKDTKKSNLCYKCRKKRSQNIFLKS